jgi:hypothetical protein
MALRRDNIKGVSMSKGTVNFVRDEKGRVIRIERLGDIPMEATLIPFIDGVRVSVQEFSKDTEKYSKRMERLTISMLILAVVQVLVAIVSIVIFLH